MQTSLVHKQLPTSSNLLKAPTGLRSFTEVVEALGGPKIQVATGRKDATAEDAENRLPDGSWVMYGDVGSENCLFLYDFRAAMCAESRFGYSLSEHRGQILTPTY